MAHTKRSIAASSGQAERIALEVVPLGRLHPWADNPRVNEEAAARLARVIKAAGFIDPIIATEDGTIRAGHSRWKAAQILKLSRVPVLWVRFPSEAAAQAYSLADNKANEWATWDAAALGRILRTQEVISLASLETDDVPLETTGFTPRERAALVTGVVIDFTAQSFDEAVRAFDEAAAGDGRPKHYWAWVVLPDQATFEALMERVGVGRGKVSPSGARRPGRREIDPDRLCQALGLAHRRPLARAVTRKEESNGKAI